MRTPVSYTLESDEDRWLGTVFTFGHKKLIEEPLDQKESKKNIFKEKEHILVQELTAHIVRWKIITISIFFPVFCCLVGWFLAGA